MVAGSSDTAVHAAIDGSTVHQTIVDGITDPDVPRVLIVKPAGTAGAIGAGLVIITGTNVEGATITDNFRLVDGDTTAITGTKAFKTVTSIRVPGMDAVGATVSVGYGNALGINHRLYPDNTTVKIVSRLVVGGTPTTQAAPTITDADDQYVEKNLITPATTPDGTTFLDIYYYYDAFSTGDINDNPVYLTTTSTSSTSSSTSTSTITTSTSSTSISTSSTSTSSTSSSTSSTSLSTSTTTTP